MVHPFRVELLDKTLENELFESVPLNPVDVKSVGLVNQAFVLLTTNPFWIICVFTGFGMEFEMNTIPDEDAASDATVIVPDPVDETRNLTLVEADVSTE